MSTLTKKACLRLPGVPAYVYKERQTAMIEIEADTFDKTIRPLSSNRDTNLADHFEIAFL